ncbi:hypothetical protein COY23_02645 [bacterium (Candidatus Torokbacteria) CG_4_10_14_0_2_um_filter_35_8]|nr:MAG: hypothetical protein COY23_02645 [bacterium (Candidatus Torokbacteria) CG_4_10_14_0_2_um_filter_35_8]
MATVIALQLSKLNNLVQERELVYATSKRILDILISLPALVIASPLMLVIAIAIKLDSKGPIIFVQKRYGYHGKIFSFYKFRSMYIMRDEMTPKNLKDKRITRVGRIIRRNFVDELPQFINILKGDMSLVGPRPEQVFLTEEHFNIYKKRSCVKPGLTGLWQINGKRSPIYQNIKYDLKYIRKKSFLLDLKILIKTIPVLIRGEK